MFQTWLKTFPWSFIKLCLCTLINTRLTWYSSSTYNIIHLTNYTNQSKQDNVWNAFITKNEKKILITSERQEMSSVKTHRCVTLFVFGSHFTPFHLHGSGSSGLHCNRILPVIAVLKLISASPINVIEYNQYDYAREKESSSWN
jgi:hypothetical protein